MNLLAAYLIIKNVTPLENRLRINSRFKIVFRTEVKHKWRDYYTSDVLGLLTGLAAAATGLGRYCQDEEELVEHVLCWWDGRLSYSWERNNHGVLNCGKKTKD